MLENMIGSLEIVRVKKTDYMVLHCGLDIETTTLNESNGSNKEITFEHVNILLSLIDKEDGLICSAYNQFEVFI